MFSSAKRASGGPHAVSSGQSRDTGPNAGAGDHEVTAIVVVSPQDAYAVADTVFAPEASLYASALRLHVLCALLTIASVVTLLGVLFSAVLNDFEFDFSWVAAFACAYTLYLAEGLALSYRESSTLEFLRNMYVVNSVDDEHPVFSRMRAKPPCIRMRMECFHDDSDSDVGSKTMITHRATQDKVFASWLELSGVAPRLADVEERYMGLMVRVEKKLEPADEATEKSFAAQAEAFVLAHKDKDRRHEFRETVEIDGFKPKVLIVAKDRKPWFVSPHVYTLATLLLLSWPYRTYLRLNVLDTTYKLHSKVSVREDAFAGIEDAVNVTGKK